MGRYKWTEQEAALLKLLKALRLEAGLTGIAVQQMLQRPNSYVSKIESGDKRLDILELRELCAVYGVSLDVFACRLEETLHKADTHYWQKT